MLAHIPSFHLGKNNLSGQFWTTFIFTLILSDHLCLRSFVALHGVKSPGNAGFKETWDHWRHSLALRAGAALLSMFESAVHVSFRNTISQDLPWY